MDNIKFSIKDIIPNEREFNPITTLKPIKSEDLILSGDIEDDRVCTSLSLNDYDWVTYNLSTRFHTKENGIIRVQWNYFLINTSVMMVTQLKDNKLTYYYVEYDSDIFTKYLTMYLAEHIRYLAPNSGAFNGEDVVIDFFNEVLEKGNLCNKASTSKDVPTNLPWSVDDNEDFDVRAKIEELSGEKIVVFKN